MTSTRESGPPIRALPTTYRGTRFRSTLEADWAATFDELGWYWQYEPVAVQLTSGAYLCDFHLPNFRTWCEVKGPHNERIEKTLEFASQLEVDPWNVINPLVVILRPCGPGEMATWEGTSPQQDLIITHCPSCDAYTFLDRAGAWQCRRCWFGNSGKDNKFWQTEFYESGLLPFTRAPRWRP